MPEEIKLNNEKIAIKAIMGSYQYKRVLNTTKNVLIGGREIDITTWIRKNANSISDPEALKNQVKLLGYRNGGVTHFIIYKP